MSEDEQRQIIAETLLRYHDTIRELVCVQEKEYLLLEQAKTIVVAWEQDESLAPHDEGFQVGGSHVEWPLAQDIVWCLTERQRLRELLEQLRRTLDQVGYGSLLAPIPARTTPRRVK